MPSFIHTSCLPQDPCYAPTIHPNSPLEASPPSAPGRENPSSKGHLVQGAIGAIGALLDDAEGSLLKAGSGRGETPGEGLLQSLHAPLTVLCQFLKSAIRGPCSGPWSQRQTGGAHTRQWWVWGHLLAGFSNVAQVGELVRMVQTHLVKQKTAKRGLKGHNPGGGLLTQARGSLTSCCCLMSLVSSP